MKKFIKVLFASVMLAFSAQSFAIELGEYKIINSAIKACGDIVQQNLDIIAIENELDTSATVTADLVNAGLTSPCGCSIATSAFDYDGGASSSVFAPLAKSLKCTFSAESGFTSVLAGKIFGFELVVNATTANTTYDRSACYNHQASVGVNDLVGPTGGTAVNPMAYANTVLISCIPNVGESAS